MTNANVTWVEDMMFVAQGDSGHAIVMDAGESGGGHDLGSRPMEVLLMGLLGCTSMDVISILKKKRQPVQGLKVFANGERNPDYPMYYTAIHLEFVAYGDVDENALARAIELSETKYCGASATLRGVAKITTSYRIERNTQGERAQQPA
jgi:putative redox protein